MRIISVEQSLTEGPPRNPEGDLYQYEMTFDHGKRRAYADTATELCNLLLGEDYAKPDDEDVVEQTCQRIIYAVNVATILEANVVAAVALGAIPDDGLDEDELEVLAARDQPPAIDVWRSTVPLFLVNAFYQPYAPAPRPRAEPRVPVDRPTIYWINVEDELEFLRSLHTVGVIQLATATAAPG